MATTTAVTFTGLNSTIDSASIIDKIIQLEQQPLDALKAQQAAFKTQVSTLGDIASKLSALQDAARALGDHGVLGVKATSTNTTFAAVPGNGATAGSYDIQVQTLAQPAKAMSDVFQSGELLQAGTLHVTTQDGVDHAIDNTAGTMTLADLATAIRASGARVSAVVMTDDAGSHLSLTALDSGYTGADKTTALQLSWDPVKDQNGVEAPGRGPGFASTQDAANATFTIDGLGFTRQSNVVTDALPGTTLTLKAPGAKETLTLSNDQDATQAKLKTYVDAYNALIGVVQKQFDVSKDSDRSSTLAGSTTVRMLQQSLQSVGSAEVGTGLVRSLADLGVKTARDGTLSMDAKVLSNAMAVDPSAVDAVFADPASGIAHVVSQLSDTYTLPVSGLLPAAQDALKHRITAMTDQQSVMQARLDAERATLQAQFNAMETVVGQYKAIGQFLTQQSNASSSNK